jgi:hypothetical protein
VSANTSTGGTGTTLYSTELLAVGYGTTFAAPTSPNTVISGGVASIAAGGGGAAASSPGPGGSGGLGGGGRGDWNSSFITNGTANTGGGGGGSRSHDEPSFGADGGSGLVLLWYSTVAPSGPVSWQYVRFSVVLARGQYSGREWQMSEFTLKYQGSPVSYTGATISPVVGGGEDNPNLIDGNLGNKAFNTSTSFTIYRASGFLFDAYTWATANDVPDRDPVRWILDASQDNATWTVLDNKSTADQTITTSRNTYVQDFTL